MTASRMVTSARGRVLVTDAAAAILGEPALPALWRILEAHGGRQDDAEYVLHDGHVLRLVADGSGGFVVLAGAEDLAA